METLLADIERFMEDHGIGAATFGQMVSNDRHLVRQLRNGRRLWPETETKVREFMASHQRTDAAA